MSQRVEAGYYINGWAKRVEPGPRRRPGTAIHLVFGPPIIKGRFTMDCWVDPLLGAYELLRYSDMKSLIYVSKHQVVSSVMVWGRDRKAIPVPATPRLQLLFDKVLPVYKNRYTAYAENCRSVVEDTANKLGIQRPVYPGKEFPDGLLKEYEHQAKEFWSSVKKHAPLVSPPLVDVGDMSGVFKGLPITSLRKNN